MLQYPNKMTFDIMEGGGVPPPPIGLLQVKVGSSAHVNTSHHQLQNQQQISGSETNVSSLLLSCK